MKKINRRWLSKSIFLLTITVFVIISAVLFLKHKMDVSKVSRTSETKKQHAIIMEEKKIDISTVNISSEAELIIRKADEKNAVKNIKNYKTLIAKLNIPEKFQQVILDKVKEGNKVPDIFIAYEYLYEKYGTTEEVNTMLKERTESKEWQFIFTQYKNGQKEFIPRDFAKGDLDKLFSTPGISASDIMNADRISQRGIKKFGELMQLRKDGQTWAEINTNLGIINTLQQLPEAKTSTYTIENYCKSLNMSKDKVMSALMIAAKTDMDDNKVLDMIKQGKSEEEVLTKFYETTYSN